MTRVTRTQNGRLPFVCITCMSGISLCPAAICCSIYSNQAIRVRHLLIIVNACAGKNRTNCQVSKSPVVND